MLRPARFTIEGLGGPYTGFTAGENWNGWEVPYFELDVAKQIAADFAAQQNDNDDSSDVRAFSTYLAEVDGTDICLYDPWAESWDVFVPVEIDGHTVYSIGARYWTWEWAGTP